MGISITRVVKFIRKGVRGNSVIVADTSTRTFPLSMWQQLGSNTYQYSWPAIKNAADYMIGDTIVVNGVVADKGGISVSYYGTVLAVDAANLIVKAVGNTIILSGIDGSSFMAQYSIDGKTNWHTTFTDGDIYMRTSADSGKTWSNVIRIVGEKGGETNYAFAWSSHATLDDSEDPLSDVVDWEDYPPKQPDGKPYLWTMITTPDGKVSYARLTGEKGDKGDKGDQGNPGASGSDAVTIDISPTAILHKKAATNTTYSITIKVFEGTKQLQSSNGSGSNFKCSVNTSNFPVGLTWSTVAGTNYFMLNLNVAANATPSKEITISIVCEGITYTRNVSFKTVADGDKGDKGDPGQDGAKGERGAVMRGPQAWSDCAVGYNFQSGADGEEFKDVVMYGNNYYSCIKSHTKTASNNPTSTIDTNNGYWKSADKVEIIATKILLAQYALVKNLGVEAIDMKDSAGNIIFQAKDGNVICNSGTFNSIKVTGDSEFSGTMKGVSGSFKSLNCVDGNGNIVGNITFGSDGKMLFDGDMYSQGYNSKQKRSNRFYTSDVWCRGMFGHYQKTMAVVKGTYMMVYTKGISESGEYVTLKTGTTTNKKTFYYIPLYNPNDKDAAGMPIDVVVFNCSSDLYYAFSDMGNGKEWRVINGNDKQTVHFCDIGGWHELGGGHSVNCMYVNPEWLNPVPGTADIARGVFWTGETDLNW